jgi:predicted NAD/FAD-binding protein
MRVAIVGSGVSGLVAAHLLHPRHDVTVFEARERIGGHVNTIEVPAPDGGTDRVDTGFIVYNEHNYPHFSKLLASLGVPTQPSNMSFSVRCDRTGLEYNGSTIPQLFAQRRNLFRPSFHRMLRDILRFNREASEAVAQGGEDLTLGEYVTSAGFGPGLAEHYLLPMGSALWSVPRTQVLEMPAAFFVRFFENHGMLTVDDRPEWRVVSGGSDRYLEPLTAPFRARIRSATPVRRITRNALTPGAGVGPPDRPEAASGVVVDGEPFDHVILACHSDQALKLLADATPEEREILGALPYQENDVVLHTDTSVLPRTRRAWGAWNYHLRGDADAPATVTYNMNVLQTLDLPRTYCVTLNATDAIRPESIAYRTTYHHPVYTNAGFKAQERHAEISGVNGTHFCGAYWGFGFHEDGARSAVRVARAFGISP